MKLQKVVRYVVIFWGIVVALFVIIWEIVYSWEIVCSHVLFLERIVLFLESIVFMSLFGIGHFLPNLIYFKVTRKTYSYSKLLIPAFLLCAFQIYFLIIYAPLDWDSVVALVFGPIVEGVLLAFGFFLGFLLEKIKTK